MADATAKGIKTYDVLGMPITRQSLLVASSGALTSLGLAAVTLWHAGRVPWVLVASVLTFSLSYLAVTLYAAYVTNCALVGRCVALSWLFVGVFAAYLVVVPLWMASVMARLSK